MPPRQAAPTHLPKVLTHSGYRQGVLQAYAYLTPEAYISHTQAHTLSHMPNNAKQMCLYMQAKILKELTKVAATRVEDSQNMQNT